MSQSAQQPRRIAFVDLLRGWAVVVMIETHVVNALLRNTLRDDAFFTIVSFINGLVAPSFTFCAGFAFAITLQKKWNDFIAMNATFRKYILRLIGILALGYSLHIPVFSLSGMIELEGEKAWQGLFLADILHIISLTLIASAFLAVLLRTRERFTYAIAALALLCVFLAPFVRALDYSQFPIWLRPYFTMQYKSQFVFFPWSAFLFAGMLVGLWILRTTALPEDQTRKRLLFASLGAIVAALLVELQPLTLYPNHDFWNASPEFFFVRIGIVCLLLAGCWFVEYKKAGFIRHAVTLIGTESLLVYVVHLIIVYGHTFPWSLIRLFGQSLDYTACFALSFAVIAAMYGLAYGWKRLKSWNMTYARIALYLTVAGFTLRFIFG